MSKGYTGARTKFNTWWNKKRLSAKATYYNVAELWNGKAPSDAYFYDCFNGKLMPKDDFIRNISDIFGVLFEEAKSHFFNDWAGSKSKNPLQHAIKADSGKSELSNKVKDSDDYGYSEKVIKDLSYKDPDHGGYGYVNDLVDEAVNYVSDDEPEEIEEPIDISRERELIMAQIYGKVDYNTFILIKDQLFIDTDEVLKFIYGQVDFETYEKIHKAMEEI